MSSTGHETELFVISDLHIGGKPSGLPGDRGFRINTHVDELAQFIKEVGARARMTKVRTELVINGDFIDFLAEEVATQNGDSPPRSFIANQTEAVATLNKIAEREQPLFDALRELCAGGVALTIVLGNHDIELSLPTVRIRLAELLGVRHETSYKFVYDGEAYTVGDVLIEHGNRYDKWNVVDFDRLRRFRSESSRRLTISDDASFEPPAGSQLVEQVMNLIKQDYPFIDLLKPETDAAVPLLLALEPKFANVMKSIEVARLGYEAMKHGLKGPARPSQPGDIASVARTEHQLDPLDEILRGRVNDDCRVELLKLADEAQQESSVNQQEIAQGIMRRALSLLRLKASGSLEARLKILLGAVRALQNDRSFDRSVETEKDLCDVAEELGREGFTTVIFGHTHLAKSVKIDHTQYINTGTWADLIRVPPEIIHGMPTAAHEELERFTQAILDKQFDKYLLFQPTFAYVCFNSEHRTVTAGLYDYESAVVQRL